MSNGKSNRAEGYPSLTARQHWGKYAAGVAVETAYILALALIALGLAFVAAAIWL